MAPWPLIPIIRRKRRRQERQQVPLPPPPQSYDIDTHRTGSHPTSQDNPKPNTPRRGVVIIDM
jgi:hypothetical protein